MKLKVCGLKDEANIEDVISTSPDFVGFIFYEKSPRFVHDLDSEFVRNLSGVKKVGVFVNADMDFIIDQVEKFGLDHVQLHGDESVEFAKSLKDVGISVIKVFRVKDTLPEEMDEFKPLADLFLFDTMTSEFGGSGRQFDWSILNGINHPFLLSGGVGANDISKIKSLDFEYLVGLDVNSKVEVSPGVKDVNLIKEVKERL